MNRITLIVGPYAVNCSLLIEDAPKTASHANDLAERPVWIVDPGHNAGVIMNYMASNGLCPMGILLTHAHFDHIGAINGIQDVYPEIPVYVHPNDVPVLTHPMNQMPPDYPPIAKPLNMTSALECPLPGLQVIETPGHTPGGVCYYLPQEQLLFSGDTLFRGSVGRTDLSGGDARALAHALDKLCQLPDDTTVIPGHADFTTLKLEKATNPFLRGC